MTTKSKTNNNLIICETKVPWATLFLLFFKFINVEDVLPFQHAVHSDGNEQSR